MLGDFLVVRQVLAANPADPVRDRALLGVMVYTFARISAVLALDLSDYYQVGRRMMFRFTEKGGRHHEMLTHHTLLEYMDAYRALLGADDGPLFRSITRRRDGYTERRLHRKEALAMVKQRCRAASLGHRFSNHTFRATGITAYLANGGQLEHAQFMAAHASPGPRSSMTAGRKKPVSKRSSGLSSECQGVFWRSVRSDIGRLLCRFDAAFSKKPVQLPVNLQVGRNIDRFWAEEDAEVIGSASSIPNA